MMKAVRVPEYGGPEVLRIEDMARPVPARGQVLLKVSACGVNPLDVWFRQGHLAGRYPRALPYTPGTDVVGIVSASGEDVSSIAVGDRVMGILPFLSDGGYAEYVVADAERLIPLPDGLDPTRAAAIMTPGVTGLQMFEKALSFGPCERALILGATGAVGRAVAAAAIAHGAEVTALVRPGREDDARALGARNVETGSDPARVAALAGTFNAIFDTIGPEAVAPWEEALAENGVAVSVVPLPPAQFARQDASAIGFAFSPDAATLARAAELTRAGQLTSPPVEVVALEEVARIHPFVLGGGGGRKFVVAPNR